MNFPLESNLSMRKLPVSATYTSPVDWSNASPGGFRERRRVGRFRGHSAEGVDEVAGLGSVRVGHGDGQQSACSRDEDDREGDGMKGPPARGSPAGAEAGMKQREETCRRGGRGARGSACCARVCSVALPPGIAWHLCVALPSPSTSSPVPRSSPRREVRGNRRNKRSPPTLLQDMTRCQRATVVHAIAG